MKPQRDITPAQLVIIFLVVAGVVVYLTFIIKHALPR